MEPNLNKIDNKALMRLKACKSPAQLKAFLASVYMSGYKDGINADVDPNVNYIAIEKGVVYECGNCNATLFLEELVKKDDDK